VYAGKMTLPAYFSERKESMSKRGNGAGSIYRRKSDRKWVGSVSLGPGQRKVFYGKTQKEVQEKVNKALYEQQREKSELAVGKRNGIKVSFAVLVFFGERDLWRAW